MCPSCTNSGSVKIRLDIIDKSLRTPERLRMIADTMNSVSDVTCDGARNFGEDLKESFCRLFHAEKQFHYDDYNGDKKTQVQGAMIDALKEAKTQYD